MNEEIEALYALLGVKPDEASVAESVGKLVKAVQSKLKSSIYGGKDGVITLPATIEGKFKNGKEINKDIKDAYAAIYEQAKKMADESVSLTLDDLKNFKAQIDKFGKKTAKYRGNDVIANANNNLRQTLSDYQDFINGLKNENAKIQRTQTKQAQKVKAQQKAKTKKASYHGITDEEVDDAIAKEDARQAKIKAWRDKQAEQLASKLGYKSSSGLDPSKTSDYAVNASEFSEYESQWARELAKVLKETYSTKLTNHFYDKEFKEGPKGSRSRATTRKEYLTYLSNAAFNDLADLIAKAEEGDESVTFDKIVEAIGVMRTIYEENGKDMDTIAKAVIDATQSRYDDNPRRKNNGTSREEGTEKGVGKGHEQVKAYQSSISQLLKKMLGEENEATKAVVKMTNAYERAKTDAKNSKASLDTKQLAQELKNSDTTKAELNKLNTSVNNVKSEVKAGTKATNTQTVYDKNANVKADTDMAKEIKVNEVNRDINKDTARAVKEDKASGFNTDSLANKLIKITENIYGCLDKGGKTTSKIALPASTKDLYKKLADPSKILGLPEPDGRRKKISNGMKDENPIRALVSIQDTMKKSLAVIPGEFAKTLKESIHPSVLDKQRHIDRPYAKDNFEYDESMLRRLADTSNARKEARRRQGGEDNTPPRVIVPDYQPQVEKSKIFASPIKQTVWDKLADAIGKLTGATKEYYNVVNAATEDQDKMAADRIVKYGLNNGRNPNDTGDIAGMRRILQLYRTNKASIEQNPELKQKIKLTEGRTVDTTAITKALNKVLSGKQMRNAQMGGSPLRQVLGSFTGFIGMPSIEKSRAQADGLNQVLGNITNALNSVLDNIQMKETELAGLEKAGKAKFNADGTLTEDSSSAAFKTLADLEEEKLVLDSIKADLLANDAIIEKTGGKFSKLVRQLSFTSPVLRQNNTVLRNINAGLDKNGKALKFQTRLAEILNYTFQLIGRSIGQWFKKTLSMLNPLNIIKNTIKTITGWIKSAFQDFGSYDTKWQRTMNVIKINFRRAIKPAMEWIAQKLVNIIGFFNIISMKVQEAFGQIPVDLFDQAAADSQKIKEELEAAANVTAGFDELHDIGGDNTGANDLLGDIYKPQLSKEWEDLANRIGDLFAGIITGDMGFGEVMTTILEILGKGLAVIGKTIWDWLKNTTIGKYIIKHWKGILATILTIFLGWKLLKIAGSLLVNALFGKLTSGTIGSLFTSIIGTGFMKFLSMPALFGGEAQKAAWAFLTPAEKILTVMKAIAGISLLVGSTIGAVSIAKNAGENWQDLSTGMKAASVAGTALMSGMAGLGAVMLGASGPIGWAIAGTVALASLVVGLTRTQDGIGSVKKETEKLQEAQENAKIANDNYLMSLDNLVYTTSNLEEIERETGLSGAELTKQVQNGELSVDKMTSAQLRCYNAYMQNEEAIKQNKKAIEDKTNAEKVELQQSIRLEIANSKKSKSYDEVKAHIIDAYESGALSAEECRDLTERAMADMSNSARQTFMEDLPTEITNGLDPTKYESAIRKLGDWFKRKIRSIKSWWDSIWGNNNNNNSSEPIEANVPHFATGTNYVPNDGLAYLHQGEAVIPKKYNQPYQQNDNSSLVNVINQLNQQVAAISSKVDQGIAVKGQFIQKGSDLVATVQKANNKLSNNILNNKVYAR